MKKIYVLMLPAVMSGALSATAQASGSAGALTGESFRLVTTFNNSESTD